MKLQKKEKKHVQHEVIYYIVLISSIIHLLNSVLINVSNYPPVKLSIN